MFIIVNSDTLRYIHVLFRHIQPYCGIIRILCNSCIFRTPDIFKTLLKHILAYSQNCVMLAYWEPCHIQNFAIFRILAHLGPGAYLESCLFGHIQAYTDILRHIPLTFTVHINKMRGFLTTITSITMIDWVYLNNTQSFKKAIE